MINELDRILIENGNGSELVLVRGANDANPEYVIINKKQMSFVIIDNEILANELVSFLLDNKVALFNSIRPATVR